MDELRSTEGPRPDGPAPEEALAQVLDGALSPLAQWMMQQRWYPAKGAGAPRLTVRGAAVIASTGGAGCEDAEDRRDARVEGAERVPRAEQAEPADRAERAGRARGTLVLDVVVRAEADGSATTDYQVPLVIRPESGDGGEDPDALITALDSPAVGGAAAGSGPSGAAAAPSLAGPERLRIEDSCRTD